MNGRIVYNGFWNSEPPEAVRALLRAGEQEGLPLTAVPNTRLYALLDGGVSVSGGNAPFALFWDKDVRLARALEQTGVRLYNTAAAVAVCDDKAATHLALAAHGLPMPQTFVAPMTYTEFGAAGEPFLAAAEQALGYPLVVKECFGSLGGQVYLARTPQELRARVASLAARPFVLQRFVAATAGEDVRLYVVGGEVIAAMKRSNDGDFRANIGAGGHGEPYQPSHEEEALALKACELLGVEIGGVDLLHEADGSALLCEVNSSAQTHEITACTGIDVARAIVCYVKARQHV